MTDKQKIATIYISVAVISALILAVTFYIRSHGLQQSQQKPYYSKDSKLEPLLTLKEDITLKNQDGEEVKISDLKGKVWAVAQFYASCPMCAERNDQGLKQLYEKFKDVPDFQLVCITVDPATDGVAEMKSYADALDASTKNWWFLTGEAEPLLHYMRYEMKYDTITKRTNPEEIAVKGEIAHNMSITVFNRSLGMIGERVDLNKARGDGEKTYRETEKKLHQLIEAALSQDK